GRQSAPAATFTAESEIDGLSMLVPPAVAKYAPVVGAFAFGLFEGWLLGRVLARERQHCCAGVRRSSR
ncbi:MAG TPA: carbon monoxide dehydrogenase, partial [Streptomyces sp.]|nr:carbon monoxide dehydrogenase [Streptomyces sp.]